MPEAIVIHSASARDILPIETKAIAEAVKKLNKDFVVKAEVRERTGPESWFEVLQISLLGEAFGQGKTSSEEVVKRIVDIVVLWARERFEGRRSNSQRPVYVAISGPSGLMKSLIIKNAVDAPEDHTDQDRQTEDSLRARLAREAAQPAPLVSPSSPSPASRSTVWCGGQHRCPACHELKPCPLGVCSVVGDMKCDSCLYIEEYGSKGAKIVQKAVSLAAMLEDAATRLANYCDFPGEQPWATQSEARTWLTDARKMLLELDRAIDTTQLRIKARSRP